MTVGWDSPLVIRNWAAVAFFCGPVFGHASPSFFCCLSENNFIMLDGSHKRNQSKSLVILTESINQSTEFLSLGDRWLKGGGGGYRYFLDFLEFCVL
jgi:hypothetical protein